MFRKKRTFLAILLVATFIMVGCSSNQSYVADDSAYGLKVELDIPSKLLADVSASSLADNITITKAEIGLYKDDQSIESKNLQNPLEENQIGFSGVEVGESYEVRVNLKGSLRGQDEVEILYRGEETTQEIAADSMTSVEVEVKALPAKSLTVVEVIADEEIAQIRLEHPVKGSLSKDYEEGVRFEDGEGGVELTPSRWDLIVELEGDHSNYKDFILLLPTEEKEISINIDTEEEGGEPGVGINITTHISPNAPRGLSVDKDGNLIWDEVENATAYRVYKSETAASDDVELVDTVSENQFVGLDEEKEYYYWIRAWTNDGYSSALSSPYFTGGGGFDLGADPAEKINLSVIEEMDWGDLHNSIGGINETIMQAFYWGMNRDLSPDDPDTRSDFFGDEHISVNFKTDYPEEGNLWQLFAERADDFAEAGFTALWFPPAHKGWSGLGGTTAADDVGYGVYDKWDLGEFDQEGSIRTKYGTRSELENAIEALRDAGVKSYYDVVFNQRFSGAIKEIELDKDSPDRAGETVETYVDLGVQKGRKANYTEGAWGDLWHDFIWDERAFTAGDTIIIDYDEDGNPIHEHGHYMFSADEDFHGTDDRTWGDIFQPSYFHMSDYLMGLNVDFYNYPDWDYQNPKKNPVSDELKAWGEWIVNDIGFDGFRMDVIYRLDSKFVHDWIHHVQQSTERDIFFVGETGFSRRDDLVGYLEYIDQRGAQEQGELENYDDLVHSVRSIDYSFRRGSMTEMGTNLGQGSDFDMQRLHESWSDALVNHPDVNMRRRATPYLDNHDTSRANVFTHHNDFDPNTNEHSIRRFNNQLYAYILTRAYGEPIVFWKDYYQFGMQEELDKMLRARKYFAYGLPWEHPEANDQGVYTYSRLGVNEVPGTGLVLLLSNYDMPGEASKELFSGRANTTYIDYTGNVEGTVTTDENGMGVFRVRGEEDRGWSIWVPIGWDGDWADLAR